MDALGFVFGTALAIGIAALAVLRWARTCPQVLLLVMPLAYDLVYVNASVFYLDYHEVFISETSTVSHQSDAALRLLFFHALIVAGVALGFGAWSYLFGRLDTTITSPTPEVCRRVLWLMTVILGIAMLNVLMSTDVPYPGSGFDRQSFWGFRLRFPIIRDLFGILAFFVPFVCAAVELYGRQLADKRLMRFARIVLGLYFVYLVIGGQVFHGLIFPLTIVAALLIVQRVHTRAKLRLLRWAPLALAGGASLLTVVYLSFKSRGISQAYGSAWDAIVYRVVALSGSSYWQADFLWTLDGSNGSFESLLHGREFLMRSIMPASLAADYLRVGVNLQGALPGTALLSLGFWPTVLICLGYGVLMGFVTSLVYAMVVKGHVLLLIPSSYLWLWATTVYGQASLGPIVNIKFLLFAAIVASASFAWWSSQQSRKRLRPSAAAPFDHKKRLSVASRGSAGRASPDIVRSNR